MPHNMSFDM